MALNARGNVGKLVKTNWQNVYDYQNSENKAPVENWVLELQCWNRLTNISYSFNMERFSVAPVWAYVNYPYFGKSLY